MVLATEWTPAEARLGPDGDYLSGPFIGMTPAEAAQAMREFEAWLDEQQMTPAEFEAMVEHYEGVYDSHYNA